MNFGFLTKDVKIRRRRLVAVTLLFSNTLAFFYLVHAFLLDQMLLDPGFNQFLAYLGTSIFYAFDIVSVIVGSLISERVNRRKFLLLWTAFGVLATASLAVFRGPLFSLLASALLGISFGLGYPSCLAFLADSTTVEERGRVSGVVFSATYAIVISTALFSSFLNLSLIELVFLIVIVRSVSLFALLLDPCERETGKEKSWLAILKSKDTVFYLSPWLIFSISYGLTLFVELGLPPSLDYQSASTIGRVLQYASAGVFALIGGVMADHFGRKQPIIIGLVMLGASYAVMGVSTSPSSWLAVLITSGIAWGLLGVSIALTVFGDLAVTGSKERVYALASIIPLIAHVSVFSISDLFSIYAPASALSSALSIMLFISVIPVLYASETLPEPKIRARKMREYVEKVGKVVEESKKTD